MAEGMVLEAMGSVEGGLVSKVVVMAATVIWEAMGETAVAQAMLEVWEAAGAAQAADLEPANGGLQEEAGAGGAPTNWEFDEDDTI